jgi:hypothetical protein
MHAGGTLCPAPEITELLPRRATGVVVTRATVHNRCREPALAGTHEYLLCKRNPDQKE